MTERVSTWAIASDYSGVIETTDGFGVFATQADALDRLIAILEADRRDISRRLSAAKRRRRVLAR